ncbi:hypothetical protein ACLMJK_004483 [Lecanora helva]
MATVTVDRTYFETLLRRAEFVGHTYNDHTSNKDLGNPANIPTICVRKGDHDNLLRMAQEYTYLRDALYRGGIEPETLEILIRGGSVPLVSTDISMGSENCRQDDAQKDFYTRPFKAQMVLSQPHDSLLNAQETTWRTRDANNDSQEYTKRGAIINSRHNSYNQEDDISWDPDLDRDDGCLSVPRTERKRYNREEQRTITVKNLSDRTTHKDIVHFVKGGLVLDIFLRTNERSASISFVEGAAAQNFMAYVKRNDIYVHGKRLEFSWNERQFILPAHVFNKIGIGATRNLVIRNVQPSITEDSIREDLDHIHNLVIINVTFQHGNVYLQLNSIHNSLFARTCMMSRATYKGMRIEWCPDKCSEPLPKIQVAPKKENVAPPVVKNSPMMNRFQMLNIDDDGTDNGSDDDNEPALLADKSSISVNNRPSLWSNRSIAA